MCKYVKGRFGDHASLVKFQEVGNGRGEGKKGISLGILNLKDAVGPKESCKPYISCRPVFDLVIRRGRERGRGRNGTKTWERAHALCMWETGAEGSNGGKPFFTLPHRQEGSEILSLTRTGWPT